VIGSLALLLMSTVLAPVGTEEKLVDLGAVMRSPGSTKSERIDALEQRLLLRSEAIEGDEFKHDAEKTRWRIDQAEDLLMGGLGLDRLGLVIIYGFPTSQEKEEARSRIDAAMSVLNQSEIKVEQGIFELEQVRASSRSGIQREMLLHYREKERDRRLPLLRGMALVHRAEGFEEGELRSRTMREALEALEGLDERLDGAASARASWLQGLALARLGNYEQAEEAFRAAATNPVATSDIVLAARLGGAVNRTVQGGPVRGVRAASSLRERYEGSKHVIDFVLIVDYIASLHTRAGRLDEASAAWSRMRVNLAASGLDADIIEAIIMERIRRLPVENPSSAALPLAVLLAHAPRADINVTEMIESVQSSLADPDSADADRSRGMVMLGSLLVRVDRRQEAASVLLAMATDYPDHPESGSTLEHAARLALQGHLSDRSNAAWKRLADSTLDRLLTGYPELVGMDGWRVAAARLAAGDGRLQESLAIYDAVRPGSSEYENAIQEGAVLVLGLSRGERAKFTPGVAVEELQRRRARGAEATQVAVDLLLVEALIEDGRSPEAAALVNTLDGLPLADEQRGRIETLRLRCAAGDPTAMAAAASAVARQRRPEGGEAISSALRTALARLGEDARGSGVEHGVVVYRGEVLPLAEAMLDWLEGMDVDDPGAYLLVAEGLRRSGRSAEALKIITNALSERKDAGQVLFERAECLYALGEEEQMAEAMGIYRRLSRVDREQAPRRWWWSQLRMLEILSTLDRDADRISPRIRQLLAEDDELGGADIRRRFENLLARHQ